MESLISLLLGLVLISGMFSLPRPTFVSSQPWRAELFSSIFLFGLSLWMLVRLRRNAFILPVRLLTLLLIFTAWSAASAAWARFPLITVHHTLAWGLYISFFVISLQLIRLIGTGPITGAFAFAALILGVLCLFDHLTVTDFAAVEGAIRIRYGRLAEMLVTVTPLLWIMAIYARDRRNRWVLTLAGALAWITVMLSLSKGAFLAGIIGSLVFFAGTAFFSMRALRRRMSVMAGVWVLLTLVFQVGFSAIGSTPATTDYITGRSDKTRSTSTMRVFTWRVSRQMILRNPMFGIGADNFGTAFNDARAELAALHPERHDPEVAEDYVVERAHNELFQVFAELGIVGFGLFIAAFGTFAIMAVAAFLRNGRRLPPVLWAAIAGMTAFFTSSFVSSFSFRAVENGIAFFIILAVAVNELLKLDRKRTAAPTPRIFPVSLALIAAASMLIYTSTKAAGQYYLYRTEHTERFDDATRYGRTSLRFDPGNAGAYYYIAYRYAKEKDFGKASNLLSEGIYRGLGVSLTYSLLAKFQLLSGDPAAAERSLSDAVKIFPNSIFLRVRYAAFLEDAGKAAEASEQMNAARTVDPRQANGWYQIIRNGSVAAFYLAKADQSLAEPAELRPESAVLEYLDQKDFSTAAAGSPSEE